MKISMGRLRRIISEVLGKDEGLIRDLATRSIAGDTDALQVLIDKLLEDVDPRGKNLISPSFQMQVRELMKFVGAKVSIKSQGKYLYISNWDEFHTVIIDFNNILKSSNDWITLKDSWRKVSLYSPSHLFNYAIGFGDMIIKDDGKVAVGEFYDNEFGPQFLLPKDEKVVSDLMSKRPVYFEKIDALKRTLTFLQSISSKK